jgi:hypothetical protein
MSVTIDPSGAPGSVPAAPDPTAALADVRNQLMRIGQQIAELRTEPGALGAEAANGVIAELREAVRFLAERLDGVARMVAQRGEELADTRGTLGAIDAHVRSQAETIAVLTTGMQALPSYGERVSALQDNINGVQQRLVGIEGAFGPLGQRLGGIESAVSRPDSGVSERLAAIEGMLGPLSQRLGQALTEQAASLQALHGRVESLATGTQAGIESLASGTQAALATPGSIDDSQIAALVAEVAAIRQAVSGLGSPPPAVDLEPLRAQLAELINARPAVAATEPGTVPTGDIEAAVRSAEQRINAHIDDAVLALATTLLGKQGNEVAGAIAPLDAPAYVPPPTIAEPAVAVIDEADADDDEFDDDDDFVEEVGYAVDANDESDYIAPIDFSRAADGDQIEPPIVAWNPTAVAPAPDPFDQDGPWAAQRPDSGYPTQAPQDDPTVVPEKRRRWFSW